MPAPWISTLESTASFLDRMRNRFQPTAAAPHLVTGEQGELAAYFHLRRLGYVVVARRWRPRHIVGDIDLIAWENDTLCFIEVKTRNSRAIASAETAVDWRKQKAILRLARSYLRHAQPPPAVRFDVLSVYPVRGGGPPEFELFRNAFGWG